MMKLKAITIIIILGLVILFVGAGCSKRTAEVEEPVIDMVWPNAPETPRIKLVTIVSKPEDFQIRTGTFRTFINYLMGKTVRSMVAPYGVETDSSGRLYVVDSFLKAIHVFDVVKNTYYMFPTGDTTLESPIDIAIDDVSGYIFVTDSKAGVVKIFKDTGKTSVGEFGKGVLERPTGIAINTKMSELLVVDTMGGDILRYALDGQHLKGIFGGSGSDEGQFNYPTNIHVTRDGTVLVSDSLNFRIQVFSPEGTYLRQFGSVGEMPGRFSRPKGIAADSDGNIYVVDALFDNVQIFDRQGRLLLAFGAHGNRYGEFWLPTGIFIDGNDRIYVSDSYNKRIQIFQYIKEDQAPKS